MKTHVDFSSTGVYCLTLCTPRKLSFFGKEYGDRLFMTPAGQMLCEVWDAVPHAFQGFRAGPIAVLPYGFTALADLSIAKQRDRMPLTLPALVMHVRQATTRRYDCGVRLEGWPHYPGRLWDHGYRANPVETEEALRHYERVIRLKGARV